MTQAVNVAALGSPGVATGFKNRIINGGMVIDQRNAGASVTPTTSVYLLDRWGAYVTQSSKFSVQQNAGSVTPPAGFTGYLGVTSLSAYSVGSGDTFFIYQRIEGFNSADLNWGTANAQTVTLSFWVRSSLTGTFGGSLDNSAATYSYPFSYTISSANTWEYKTITIPGSTNGSWVINNGMGIELRLNLGTGSTYSGTANTWANANYVAPTGATSVVGTNGATWYVTGVQFEVGTTATTFDFRSYGTELALCQRYYWKDSGNAVPSNSIGSSTATTSSRITAKYPVTMRAAPTFAYNNLGVTDVTYYSRTLTSASSSELTATGGLIVATCSGAGLTVYAPAYLYFNGSDSFYSYSAEL